MVYMLWVRNVIAASRYTETGVGACIPRRRKEGLLPDLAIQQEAATVRVIDNRVPSISKEG
jgi:hypothetical protein